ncbi:MAG: hypothetical protein ABI970_18815, partial [Chloroflexota bacterium]
MKRLLIMCVTLLLAACGAASQSAGTPIPTVNAAGLTVSSFKGTVSGAVTGDFSGTGSYFKQDQGGLLISLVGTQGPSGASVTIILPTGTVAGTYTPKSYADAYDSTANKITGIGASFSVLNKSNGTDAYTTISEGTLTLQSVDPMTGSIQFKATLEGGGTVEV